VLCLASALKRTLLGRTRIQEGATQVAEGLTSDLMFEAGLVAIAAFLIAWHDLPIILALPVVLIRLGISTVYFAEYFDGSWCMQDDIKYFNDAAGFLDAGWTPLSAILLPEGYDGLRGAAGGHHILYHWWNILAMYLFGTHYYSAVMLNILLTFVTGFLLHRITKLLGFSQSYCIGLQVLFLLHWDVITWSSFINLKDCLVQTLTVAAFYCILRFCQLRDWFSVVGFLLILQLFYWLRFYLPALILMATVLWALWQWKDSRKFILVPIVCAGTYFALLGAGDATGLMSIRAWAYGMCVITLTPLPWTLIDDIYEFMMPAAAFHTLFLLPAAYGTWQLWKSNRTARLFIVYMLIVLSFYAMTEDIRGSRQRTQLSFIFAWVQFQFLWSLRSAPAAKTTLSGQIAGRPHLRAPSRPVVAHT
jgi:hypothetical protein